MKSNLDVHDWPDRLDPPDAKENDKVTATGLRYTGTDLLDKIKAGMQIPEIVWIFFGILTSNAVMINKRRTKASSEKKGA